MMVTATAAAILIIYLNRTNQERQINSAVQESDSSRALQTRTVWDELEVRGDADEWALVM